MLNHKGSTVLDSLFQETQRRHNERNTNIIYKSEMIISSNKDLIDKKRRSSCDILENNNYEINIKSRERQCPLCLMTLPLSNFIIHLKDCSSNVRSCDFCNEAIPISLYDDHAPNCLENKKECYVCHNQIQSSLLSQHLRKCAPRKEIIMFHGTSLEAAKHIMREGFKPSIKGVLGEGIYLSRDVAKASNYGFVIVECIVRVGNVILIESRDHRFRKCWAKQGYNSAWIPPGVNVTLSGMEEHCVYDTRRVVPSRFFSVEQVKSEAVV